MNSLLCKLGLHHFVQISVFGAKKCTRCGLVQESEPKPRKFPGAIRVDNRDPQDLNTR